MLESNFPVDKQSCGYGQLWNAFKQTTAGLAVAEALGDTRAIVLQEDVGRLHEIDEHLLAALGLQVHGE